MLPTNMYPTESKHSLPCEVQPDFDEAVYAKVKKAILFDERLADMGVSCSGPDAIRYRMTGNEILTIEKYGFLCVAAKGVALSRSVCKDVIGAVPTGIISDRVNAEGVFSHFKSKVKAPPGVIAAIVKHVQSQVTSST